MESLNKEIAIEHSFDSRYVKNFINRVSIIKSDVYFEKDGRRINAKSIIGLLSLNINMGDMVGIYVSGNDRDLIESDMSRIIHILGE